MFVYCSTFYRKMLTEILKLLLFELFSTVVARTKMAISRMQEGFFGPNSL